MSNLWPRVEPLLARVEKPARYIGMERGSLRPEHRPSSTSWLLVYPDTYEIGLPNQGLQILYEILNERDDALAERIRLSQQERADKVLTTRLSLAVSKLVMDNIAKPITILGYSLTPIRN